MSNKYARSRTPSTQTFHKSSVAKAISAAIITSMISLPLFAEEVEEEEIETIMVTATKKSETLQEVPLAMTALTGDFIQGVHLTDAMDLVAYSPGVSGATQNSFLDALNVRGIRSQDYGSGGDPSLGFFKNDQYEGRAGSAISTLFDMNRAEIINGPQGFLFGRNAIGGAISVHTNEAQIDGEEASFDVDLGDYSLMKLNGAINVPINDNLAMRFAGVYHTQESHIENENKDDKVQDTDVLAARWSTTFEKDDLRITTMVEYEDRVYPAGLYRFIEKGELWEEYDKVWEGNRGGDRDLDTNSHWGLKDEAQVLNLQVKLVQEFDFADLTVNAGYKDHDYLYTEQWTPSPLESGSWKVDQTGDYTQAELRLSSNGTGPLSWYVGTSLYEENLDVDTLNQMSDEFICDYYSAYYNDYDESTNYFPSLEGSQSGHCENLYNNSLAYHGPGYYGFDPTDGYYGVNYYFPHLSSPYGRADDKVFENSYVNAKNDGWAAYANLDYQITDTINIEIGIRHTVDNKEFNNAQEVIDSNGNQTVYSGTPGYNAASVWNIGGTTALDANGNPIEIKTKKDWDNTSMKYLIRWQPTDEMMFYASFTEGYKSGGFNSHNFEGRDGSALSQQPNLTNELAQSVAFGEESIDSYELGYKDTWFDFTDIRLTVYSYEYDGLQVSTRVEGEGGQTIISNLGLTEANGFELATNTPLGEYFNLMFNYSYLDSDINEVPEDDCSGEIGECNGNKIPWAPETSGSMVLNGFFPLDSGATITTSIESYWEDEHGGGYMFDEVRIIEASQTWNARIGYESSANWYVQAYVDNLLDETNFDSSYGGGANYPSTHWAAWKPRSYGLRFGMSWN
ncbi:TonB-dependent receptor [Thalassotalea psychrophila]|uniref:TonB-dependent receptor n=1 Tax=Thalassotalea psychrophila TaxID=3065647 RepID=A0ABY9TU65_9GAMM|nr:TonB-dependent receptor [Colwelliaceae bacterium SQ149]